jgi:hypothetical protein
MTAGKNKIFDYVSSRRYAKSYLKGVTGRLQDSEDSGFVYEAGQNEYTTSTKRGMTEENRYCGQREYHRRQNTGQRR